MSTLSALQILADVTSAHAASSPYAQTHASNEQPPSWTQPAPFDATSAASQDESPQLQTMQPVQPPPPTEASLRAQLDQTDLYDLSGEKAAAEALKREDAFKEQQIQEKAQQTKEFFAEQDRKQQESLQEMQKQADAQLAEKSQKEFWDAKQAQETQASMDNELRGLHESAQQEHQQWRADFTQGICRDDAAALVNNQIEDRVGAYQDRLTDMGSNAVDAAATVDKYKVKLESESSAEIASRTAELHQEHFPEYQGIAPAKPDGPASANPDAATPPKPDGPLPGEIPSSGFGPFEGGPQGGYGLEGLVNKKGDSGPWEATAGPTPDKPFMRPMMDPRGDGTVAPEGWFKNVDELPKQDAPPGWFKNVDAPPADGKDIPDGFMKRIDEPVGERVAAALKAAGSSAAAELSEAGKLAKDFGQGVKTGAEEIGEKLKNSAQEFGDKAKASAQEWGEKVKTEAQELGEKAKAGAQELGEKAKAAGTSAASELSEGGKFAKETLTNPENIHLMAEHVDHVHEWGVIPGIPHDVAAQMGQQYEILREIGFDGMKAAAKLSIDQAKDFGEGIKTGAEELGGKIKDSAQELGGRVKEGAQELGGVVMTSAQEFGQKAKVAGDKAMAGAHDFGEMVKEGAGNLKISFPSTLDQKVKEDVKPQTEFNKGQAELHQSDVSAWEQKARQRAADLNQTAEQANIAAAAAGARATAVDQMKPPTPPAATITTETPGQPAVTPATPATPTTPAATAPTTPPVSLAKTSPS